MRDFLTLVPECRGDAHSTQIEDCSQFGVQIRHTLKSQDRTHHHRVVSSRYHDAEKLREILKLAQRAGKHFPGCVAEPDLAEVRATFSVLQGA